MPARRGRPKKGDGRMDAAIDHFAVMGYARRDVRAVVNDLLKVYGGPDAWHLLEDGCYEVVRNRLFEIEEEEKEKQDQQLLLEHNQQPLLEDSQQLLLEHHQQEQDRQQVEDESPQHQEPPADEKVEDPMFIEAPPCEAALPLNEARKTGPRRPCYGWLSESEDEEEEEPTVADTNLARSTVLQ